MADPSFNMWDKVSVTIDDVTYAGTIVLEDADGNYGVSVPALGEVKVGSVNDLDIQAI